MRKLENTRDLQQWVREREQHIIVLSGPLLATSGIIAGLQHVNEGCQCHEPPGLKTCGL